MTLDLTSAALHASVAGDVSPKLDLSIESMRSQAFGHGVFVFLLIGIAVFGVIISIFWKTRKGASDAKLGEKVLFVMIIAGVVVAIAFGALQMVGGYLF